MTTFAAQPPCTPRLSGEWRFVFTADLPVGRQGHREAEVAQRKQLLLHMV